VQLNRLYSNLDDLFTPIHFNAVQASTLLNVIFAEVKRKRAKDGDSHNLGKTTLIALIDFMLLKDSGRRLGSVSDNLHGRLQSGWVSNLTLPERRSLSTPHGISSEEADVADPDKQVRMCGHLP
jgi:hypothetical protein